MKKTGKKRGKKDERTSIVVYDNNFIEAFYQTDYLAKKIMITASLRCQDGDWKENEDYETTIPSSELKRISGLQKNSLKHLEGAVDKLHNTSVRLRDPNNNKNWVSFNYLPKGEYKDGELFLRVNREMRPFVLGLKKNFTQYHIENVKPLKSGYSIRIFEMLKMNAWKSETYRIKLDELKKMFGIEDKYKLYTDFKKDVIERAKTELKEHCEIYFEYLEIKHGNKVSEIEFTILRQSKEFSVKELPVAAPPPADYIDIKGVPEELPKEDGPYQEELFDMSFQGQYSELGQKLIKMGFMGDPEKFIQDEGKELVEITLKAVEATSGVNNPIGLLRERVKAIKIQTLLLMQEQEAKRKREESDLKFAREKELVAETRMQESKKREREDDVQNSLPGKTRFANRSM